MNASPRLIAIDHDDYHAEFVGQTRDEKQFFLTTPFESATATQPSREFIALYLFDAGGTLLEAKINDLGTREGLDHEARVALRDQWLGALDHPTFMRIEIRPFAVEGFGLVFGLVLREPEDEADDWVAEVLPGNYMAFFAPWDSGIYDT